MLRATEFAELRGLFPSYGTFFGLWDPHFAYGITRRKGRTAFFPEAQQSFGGSFSLPSRKLDH